MSEEYLGCGNHSCRFEKPKGMGTNAGCSCLEGVPFERRVKILKAFERERKRVAQAEAIAKAAYETLQKAINERDTATKVVEDIQGKVAMYDGKRRVAEAALKRAEAERDEAISRVQSAVSVFADGVLKTLTDSFMLSIYGGKLPPEAFGKLSVMRNAMLAIQESKKREGGKA